MTKNLPSLALLLILLSMGSCKKNADDPTANTLTTATSTSEYFSQCKTGNYLCYGDNIVGSVLTTLVPIQSSTKSYYEFSFGMIVDKDPYQQLTVNISLTNFSGKGIYTLTSTNTDVYYVVRPAATTNYQSSKVTGTLQITEYLPKKYLTGTFAITSSNNTNSLELKEGTLKVEADF